MVFIVKSDTRGAVRERIDYIIDGIEKQGRFDYKMYIRDIEDGLCVGALKLRFHKKAYPSDYRKPDVLLVLPGSHS